MRASLLFYLCTLSYQDQGASPEIERKRSPHSKQGKQGVVLLFIPSRFVDLFIESTSSVLLALAYL
jgi:hypothetical protein